MAPFKMPFSKRKNATSTPSKYDKSPASSQRDVYSEYDVADVLGRGGFATVLRAHKKGAALNKEVAMRKMPLQEAISSSVCKDVQDLLDLMEWAKLLPERYPEIRTAHTLLLLDYVITKTELFTFSEVCEGGDLFDRIISSPDGHLTEDDARITARILCQAIAHVHNVGAIHRDVKPENILCKTRGGPPDDVWLTDFGCSITRTTRDAMHQGIAGSPGYMPPEMLSDQPYNMLVDEWSLGITIYECITGRSPLVSETPELLAQETLARAIPYPSRYWRDVSHDAKNFVSRLLNKDPQQRMTVEEALKHPWLTGRTQPLRSAHSSLDSDADGTTTMAMRKTTRRTYNQIPQHRTTDVLAGRVAATHLTGLKEVTIQESEGEK